MDKVKLKTNDTCVSLHVYYPEMRFGLNTTILNGFYRMVNRRVPLAIITDNGGYFVAANKTLKELASYLDEEKIKEATSLHKIK